MFQFGGAWGFVWGTKPIKASPWRLDWVYVQDRRYQTFSGNVGYPFSISIDEHVFLQFLVTKRLWKITRMDLSIRI